MLERCVKRYVDWNVLCSLHRISSFVTVAILVAVPVGVDLMRTSGFELFQLVRNRLNEIGIRYIEDRVHDHVIEQGRVLFHSLAILSGSFKPLSDTLLRLGSAIAKALFQNVDGWRLDEDVFGVQIALFEGLHACELHIQHANPPRSLNVAHRFLACPIRVPSELRMFKELIVLNHRLHLVLAYEVVVLTGDLTISGVTRRMADAEGERIRILLNS